MTTDRVEICCCLERDALIKDVEQLRQKLTVTEVNLTAMENEKDAIMWELKDVRTDRDFWRARSEALAKLGVEKELREDIAELRRELSVAKQARDIYAKKVSALLKEVDDNLAEIRQLKEVNGVLNETLATRKAAEAPSQPPAPTLPATPEKPVQQPLSYRDDAIIGAILFLLQDMADHAPDAGLLVRVQRHQGRLRGLLPGIKTFDPFVEK